MPPDSARPELGVARDPLREKQLVVHRDVDALRGHPEGRLEFADRIPPPSRIAVVTLGRSAAERDEELHDRADVEDHAAAQDAEGILHGTYRPSATVA